MEVEKGASCSVNEFKELHDLKDVKVENVCKRVGLVI